MITVVNLTKNFRENGATTEVLKGINLSINEGESVGIVGASGAGKSTLLHIIGTLECPTTGEVLFEGKNLFNTHEKTLSSFRNRSLGFVFQFHHLLPDFTALENVMIPLLIRREPNHKARESAREVLEKVGLSERLIHKPAQLSGGEQQRVAIARALVGKPRLVLADEPSGNLDSENGRQVFDLLLGLNRELKTTLVVVTHNEELAKSLDRVLSIIDGKISPSQK